MRSFIKEKTKTGVLSGFPLKAEPETRTWGRQFTEEVIPGSRSKGGGRAR